MLNIIFLALLTVSIAQKPYESFKLLKINFANDTDLINIYEVAEKYLADIWKTNQIEGWLDVMIPPENAHIFDKWNPVVLHDNVQQMVDESEYDRANNSQGDVFFSNFRRTTEILTWLTTQRDNHPTVAQLVVAGHAHSGEEIVGIKLAAGANKKKFFIQCTIHSREWISTSSCCWFIDSLLNTDPDRQSLLNAFEWLIVPVLNVDGYNYAHTTSRLWRKNRQPNSGSSCIGTDLNRNYAYGFAGGGSSANPCAETFRGARAFSGPETDSVQQYLRSYVNSGLFTVFLDIHAYGAMWMSPYGNSMNYPPDYPAMLKSMQEVKEVVDNVNGNNYAIGTSARVIYIAAGGSDDNAYGTDGVIQSFTVEAYGSNFTPPVSYIPWVGAELWAGVKCLAENH